jgi:sec-independent protein translocase protein TatC
MRLPRRLQHGQGAELVDHLDEFRSRLVVSLVAVGAAFGVAYAEHQRLVHWLEAPLPGDRKLVTYGVAEPFLTSLQVSFAAGIALALPIVLWQLWSFLAPAVEPNAQRAVMWCVVAATALFACGLAFGYGVALPAALKFLTNYDSSIYDIQIRAKEYISFAVAVLVAVGVVFEMPAVIVTLARLGIVKSQTLRAHRRIGYAITAVVAVALPGIDPVTTVLEMIPLFVLFEASIWLSVLAERRRRVSLAASTT